MNETYAKRDSNPAEIQEQSTGTEVLNRILKSQRESEERSAKIIEHYRFNKTKNAR